MGMIFFVGGEKGGSGKSFVARTIIQYWLDHNLKFEVVECDRSNPDVMRIYGKDSKVKCHFAVFSEAEKHEDQANYIYNAGVKNRVLVNLPAQVLIPVRNWFENNDILQIAAADGVQIRFFFVSDGGWDSLSLCRKSLELFGTGVPHIVVKNYGRTEDWEALGADAELQALIAATHTKVIDFPKFIGSVERHRMDAESISFGVAREHKSFSSISRQRVKTFLRKAYEAFEAGEVFA